MDEEELLSVLAEEIVWASDGRDERTANGEEAIDYFYGELPPPPSEEDVELGMSDIVSTDVQDAVYAVCAELMPAFSGASPVEFQPVTEQDEQQAAIETRATNHAAQNCGLYNAVNAAVMDAMLRRAGIVKVFWEEKREARYERHDDIPLQMLPEILQQVDGGEGEIVEAEMDEAAGTVSGTLRTYVTRSRPRIEAVPRDEFLISADLSEPYPDDARMVAHQRPVSRSELVELGMDPSAVAMLDTVSQPQYGATARARDSLDQHLRSAHESTEQVMCVEAYYRVDWDGDGIAERRRIVTAGGAEGTDTLLLNEPWDQQPFCVGVGYLGIFSWDGVSLFDRLKMIQDVKTDLIRDIRNMSKRNMRQRLGVLENAVNMDDMLTSHMGGIIRMRDPNAVMPIPEVQLPASVFQLLDYMDKMRKERGGGAIDATASAQVLGQGGDWSLERLMAATEQINAMVAKNLVETLLKPIYRKLHNLLRQYHQGSIALPGSTGWQHATPGEWSERDEMAVTMGMSVGERTQRIGALQQIQQQQMQDAQSGMVGVLSDASGVYQARIDMARLAGLPGPEQYYVDPASPQAQQAQQQAAQQAQQAQQAAQQAAQEQMQFNYELMTQLEKIKAESRMMVQQMQEQSRQMQTQMDNAQKMFGHQVDLVGIEQKANSEEAQRQIDAMQAAGKLRVETIKAVGGQQ